ncbi:hypothetical protein [Nocardia rhamnosiphila]
MDREFGEITVFSQPSGARYQRRVTVSIGDSVDLPTLSVWPWTPNRSKPGSEARRLETPTRARTPPT